MDGRPRRHDGAPLRRRHAPLGRGGRLVVPVVTTGLHCGGIDQDVLRIGPASSPSSRRGSIAATRSAGIQSGPNASSPSSRRGSIAAARIKRRYVERRYVVPVVTTGLHCGLMQRFVCGAVLCVVPVVTTGLHCGSCPGGTAWPKTPVVPVVTTGLHCGDREASLFFADDDRSSPSSRRGSIAARSHAVRRATAPSRRPRRHDGAPLRLHRVPRVRQLDRVVPVVTTGLHCG